MQNNCRLIFKFHSQLKLKFNLKHKNKLDNCWNLLLLTGNLRCIFRRINPQLKEVIRQSHKIDLKFHRDFKRINVTLTKHFYATFPPISPRFQLPIINYVRDGIWYTNLAYFGATENFNEFEWDSRQKLLHHLWAISVCILVRAFSDLLKKLCKPPPLTRNFSLIKTC